MSEAFSATRTSSRIRTEAEVLEAEAGLEAEASLEAAVAWRRAWRQPTWKAWSREGLEAAAAAILEADCGDHPGGPGGGVLEGPEAAAPHPAVGPVEVQAVGPVEVLEETVPAVEDGWGIRRWRIEGVTGDEDHCSGADDPPPPLIFPEKRPHGAGGQTSSSLKRPSSLMTDWFFILRTSSRSRGQT
ncbi:unnamed protein product [Boreogadus saida]